MATLFNTKISQTYEGLLKTIDNASISATLKELTDGSGNQSGLYLNTAGDFKVSAILEWGSLKDTGTGVTITRFVTSTDGIENFDNNTSLPTSAAVKLYVDTKFSQTDTLQEVLGFGNTTSGKDIAVSAGDDITFTDTSKILMGASSDLQIYHDGSNSYINENGSGDLRISTNGAQVAIQNGLSEDMGRFIVNGSVILYYDNVQKFQTTSTGISVVGVISNVTNPITAQDAATKSYVDALDAGSNLDITDGTTTGVVNLNTQALSILGTTNEIETAVSGQGVTIGLPSSISTNLVGNVTGDLTGNVTGNLTGTASKINVTAASVDQNEKVLLSTGVGSQSVVNDAGLLFNPVTNLLTVNGSGTFTGDLNVTGNITGGGGSFLPLAGGTMTGNTIHNDNVKSIYGTANDGLEIYHDGTHSYVDDSGTGKLILRGNSAIELHKYTGEYMITAVADGAVSLYYNDSKKLETTSTGISVTGNGSFSGEGFFSGGVQIPDSSQLKLGSSSDFKLYHDGFNSYLRSDTGTLYFEQAAVTQSIIFNVSDANSLDTTALTISRNADASFGRDVTIAGDLTVNGTTTTVNSQTLAVVDPLIQLAKDNTANSLDIGMYGDYNDGTGRYLGLFSDASDGNKFKLFKGTTVEPTTTVDIGAAGYAAADLQVAGLEATTGTFSGTTTFNDHSLHPDQVKSKFGNNGDLEIYHDGSNSFIQDTGTGSLKTVASGFQLLNATQNQFMILADGGATSWVKLYYAGSERLATTSTGVSVTGDGTFSGGVAFSGGAVRLISNQLQSGFNQNSDNTDFWINYQGYQGGTTYFRDFRIGDGKQNQIAFFDGSTKNSTFAGDVIINKSSGKIDFRDGGGSSKYFLELANSNADLQINDRTGAGSVSMTIQSGGNIGIGTTSIGTNDKLLIKTSVDNSVAQGLVIQRSANTDEGYINYNGGGFQFRSTDGDPVVFGQVSNERMRIDGAGNIGIGTTSPNQLLEVANNAGGATISISTDQSPGSQAAKKYTNLDFTGYNNNVMARVQSWDESSSTGHGNLTFSTRNASTGVLSQAMIINYTGNVGIGTDSPAQKLHIVSQDGANIILNSNTAAENNGIFMTESTAASPYTNGAYMHYDSTANAFKINTGTTTLSTKFTILRDSGNVGIGTDSPAYKTSVFQSGDYNGSEILLDLSIKDTVGGSYNGGTGAGISFSSSHWSVSPTEKVMGAIYGANTDGGSSANGYLSLRTRSSDVVTERMRITSAGELQLTGNGVIKNQESGGNFTFLQQTSSDSRLFVQYSQPLLFGTNATERMRITSGGNVGIKNNDPGATLEVNAQGGGVGGYTGFKMKYGTSSVQSLYMGQVTAGNGAFIGTAQYVNAGYWQSESTSSSVLSMDSGGNFSIATNTGLTANTNFTLSERFRITNVGRTYINSNAYSRDAFTMMKGDTSTYVLGLDAPAQYAGLYRYQSFFSGSNIAGTITGSNQTSISYNTSSDYRMKKNIKPLENGLKRLCELNPVKFDWKENDSSTEGFIAHEVQEIFPDAISGEKDGELMQGMDYGRITPLLVKAIQELTAKVEMLEKNCQCKN